MAEGKLVLSVLVGCTARTAARAAVPLRSRIELRFANAILRMESGCMIAEILMLYQHIAYSAGRIILSLSVQFIGLVIGADCKIRQHTFLVIRSY